MLRLWSLNWSYLHLRLCIFSANDFLYTAHTFEALCLKLNTVGAPKFEGTKTVWGWIIRIFSKRALPASIRSQVWGGFAIQYTVVQAYSKGKKKSQVCSLAAYWKQIQHNSSAHFQPNPLWMNKYKMNKYFVKALLNNPTVLMAASYVFGKYLCFRNCKTKN